jgi:L-alanine-DL-glutamate epimerase-like enolase superfamily enzyme
VSSNSGTSRRSFLKAAYALSLSPMMSKQIFASPPRKASDIRIKQLRLEFHDFTYRTPYEFGGRSVDATTLLNIHCTVETVDGRVAEGFGSMPLGNSWSFPSKTLSYETTLEAMKRLSKRIGKITEDYTDPGHPIEINFVLEPAYLRAAEEVAKAMQLNQPIPKLCTLVTASAIDAAIHDAFGKVHRLNCYLTYGPEFMMYDLGRYLSPEFKGKYPSQYLLRAPKPWLWCNHSVGAADPIKSSEIKKQLNDGLPQSLEQWIVADGLTHLKIKLDGNNLDRDVARVVEIDQVARSVKVPEGVRNWRYSLDFNEQCPDVEYLLDFIRHINQQSPGCFERITFIEQPTRRDLVASPEQYLFQVSKMKPVVMDESLTGFDALLRGREIGYSGVALKACKGQSQSMLMNAAAQEFKMYLTAQDLTCPGASLIQSAGIASHVPQIDTLESNAREYVPAGNAAWVQKFPGLFEVRDGKLHTATLTGLGLGAV